MKDMARLKKEHRSFVASNGTEFRALEEDGKRYLIGYASVFNQKSKLIFEQGRLFYEIISPEAFRDVLADENLDVKLTFNHSRDKVIARTRSNTLQLSTDEKGLLFKAELPNVSYANDVYELVRLQTLFENSFAFVIDKGGDEWSRDTEGNNIRLIKRVSKLIDVSVVTDGAYANTDVAARKAEVNLDRGQKKITIIIEDQDDEEEPEEEPMVEEDTVEENGCGCNKKKIIPLVLEQKAEETVVEQVTTDTVTVSDLPEDVKEGIINAEKSEEKMKLELEKLEMHLRILKLKY